MDLTQAKEEVKRIVRSSELDGENVIFIKSQAGWYMFNEFKQEDIGENEALDYLSKLFQADYIIVNLEEFLELRFDASEEERRFLRAIYQVKGLMEDFKELLLKN